MTDIIGWGFFGIIAFTFWLSAVRQIHLPFLWANAIGLAPIAYLNFRQEAWHGLAFSLMFGASSIWGLLKLWRTDVPETA